MSWLDYFDLGRGFRRHFEILPAHDERLRDEVYSVRHEVYCEELKFEPLREDGRETDDFDNQSHHCLMLSRSDPQQRVGCVRLVTANPSDPYAPLPFEISCRDTLDRAILDTARLPRERIAEVSRLAVRRAYRRRRGEEKPTTVSIQKADYGSPMNPRFPYIPIGLYLGSLALAEQREIEYLFMLTEPRLASHFSKLGLDVQTIGGPIEHRGKRLPSMIRVESILKRISRSMMIRRLWHEIRGEIHHHSAKT